MGGGGGGGGTFVHALAPGENIKIFFKNAATLLNKRPSYLISRGRTPRNPIKILNKCPLSFHYFALKITYVPWAQNWSKDWQVFFYFTAVSGNGFVQYTKAANVDKNFSF